MMSASATTDALPQHELSLIAISKLKVEERIGCGSFATVYRAHHLDWGCYVAYKKLKLEFSETNNNEKPRLDTVLSKL